MGNPPAADVSWLSPLGISITLFLVYGALNVIVGLVIPIISRRLSSSGWPQATIDLMSGLWLGLGILQSAVVWFGLERRRFKGPPIGDAVKRRAHEIAEAERLVGEG